MLKAVTRQAALVDAKIRTLNSKPNRTREVSTAHFFEHYATEEDVAVEVTEQDFMDAQRELVPSVSAGELAHYEKVKRSFEGGRNGSAADGVNGKGKGKEAVGMGPGKGKGKAVEIEDDALLQNGGSRREVKGNGGATFQDGNASDDDSLY